MKFVIKQTQEFNKWFLKQNLKIRVQISARLNIFTEFGNTPNSKALGANLFEFKWKSGLRIYFTFHKNKIVLLLNGGNKNDQKKDIERAKKLKAKYLNEF